MQRFLFDSDFIAKKYSFGIRDNSYSFKAFIEVRLASSCIFDINNKYSLGVFVRNVKPVCVQR